MFVFKAVAKKGLVSLDWVLQALQGLEIEAPGLRPGCWAALGSIWLHLDSGCSAICPFVHTSVWGQPASGGKAKLCIHEERGAYSIMHTLMHMF